MCFMGRQTLLNPIAHPPPGRRAIDGGMWFRYRGSVVGWVEGRMLGVIINLVVCGVVG